jgi:hypothetical protein
VPFDCQYQYVHGHDACVSACPTRARGAPFTYLRREHAGTTPSREPATLDIAVLDMNHGWPNLGHDSVVHSLRHIACDLLDALNESRLHLRVTSYDVRRHGGVPRFDDEAGLIVVGTGGPGHIDPARNDGVDPGSQGIAEDPGWEPHVFELFDRVLAHPEGVLLGICHTFGVMCRWRDLATPTLRGPAKGGKSVGIQENLLTPEAQTHPWFRHLIEESGPRIEVLDSRLYDLMPAATLPPDVQVLGHETLHVGGPAGPALTMLEMARDVTGTMPRVFGVNHHPEIVNRPRQLALLRRRRAHGDISDEWYDERRRTLMQTLDDRGGEEPLALTSSFSLHGPLRFHVTRHLRTLAARLGRPWSIHEHEVPLAMTRAGQVLSIAELEVRS